MTIWLFGVGRHREESVDKLDRRREGGRVKKQTKVLEYLSAQFESFGKFITFDSCLRKKITQTTQHYPLPTAEDLLIGKERRCHHPKNMGYRYAATLYSLHAIGKEAQG